jgi:ankyrin repeat protein
MVAAFFNPSAEIVRKLLGKGADPKAVDHNGWTTLNAAAIGNDTATIRMLVDAGVDVNAPDSAGPNYFGSTPLMNAAQNGNLAAVKLLLAAGAKVNAVASREKATQVKNGHVALGGFTPLMLAAPFGPPELIQTLLDAGAEVNVADIRGMTPLMLSIVTDRQNPEIVKMLLAHGADTKPKSLAGETALDWARKMGARPAIEALNGQKLEARIVPIAADTPDLGTAVDRSVALLEKSMATYFVGSGCYGCHAQVVTDFAIAAARAKGVTVDEKAINARRLQTTVFLNLSGPSFMERQDLPGSPDIILFPLESLARTGYAPDRVTDFLVAQMAAMQWPEGRWHLGAFSRTPIEDGDFTRTALGIRALKTYGTPGRALEMKARIERAKQWLLHNQPLTTEDYDMRMVGVASAGSDPATLRSFAKPILDRQRADGGWAQRDELSSDAYATGMTLWALAEAGMVKPSGGVYQRGAKFLLATQAADGSWHVASRALKLQPYFEGGFPYGHDQWISSMATGWATNALALALEPPAKQVARAGN